MFSLLLTLNAIKSLNLFKMDIGHTIGMCAVFCVLPIPVVIECECMQPLVLVHPRPIPLVAHTIHFSLHLAHFRIIDWISCMRSVDIAALSFTAPYWTCVQRQWRRHLAAKTNISLDDGRKDGRCFRTYSSHSCSYIAYYSCFIFIFSNSHCVCSGAVFRAQHGVDVLCDRETRVMSRK